MNTKVRNAIWLTAGVVLSVLLVAVGCILVLLYMYYKFMHGLQI